LARTVQTQWDSPEDEFGVSSPDGWTNYGSKSCHRTVLCVFVHKKPTLWGKLLHWVEWSYNTSKHSGSGVSPYEITFGKKPITLPQYITSTLKVDAVDDMFTNREAVFEEVRKKLMKAQAVMKHFADHKHRDVTFQVGDIVMVKLRPYKQTSVAGPQSVPPKLAKRFYGPF